MNAKVEQFYNKNQFLIYDSKNIIFQSYESTIAKIDKTRRTLTLFKNWDYSNTTRKHLYLFLTDFDIFINNITNELIYADNKRAYIQKLIDNKIIKYINK